MFKKKKEATAMRSPYTATKSSPCSLQLERARAQQRRPNAAKNKFIKKKKEEKKRPFIESLPHVPGTFTDFMY